jgi:hypothetical protein
MISSKFISAVTNKVRTLKVLCFGGFDVRTAKECLPYGVDSNPIANMIALYASTTQNSNAVIVGYINTNQLAQTGETRIFATDVNGVEQTRVWLHSDGTIELGGTGAAGSNTNHAVQYEALKTAFDQLKTDFNNHIALYTAHVHTGGTIFGSTGVTTPSGTASSADMSGAKLTKIKTQ